MKPVAIVLASLTVLLSGCDLISQRLGIEDPQQKEAKADAEGRAVGSACRQSGRAIEDCYSLYRWLPKASIFAGWREMNDYMQANNLGIVEPKLPPTPGPDDRKRKITPPAAETKSDEKKTGADEKMATRTDSTEPSKTDDKSEKKIEAKSGPVPETKKDGKSSAKG